MEPITCERWESTYYMNNTGGHRSLVEDPDQADEIERVEQALAALAARGMVPAGAYDQAAFGRLRGAVREHFVFPWTSITPVMERLLFAVAAVTRPKTVCCVGIFGGNTLVWNVGAGTGPGQVYDAETLVGCEVVAEHVEQARNNFAKIGAPCDIRQEDGHLTVRSLPEPIDLLYLDANGGSDHPDPRQRGKRIYTTLLEAAYDRLAPGALIIAHDTVPDWFVRDAGCYFELCRDRSKFAQSVEVRIDEMGVEVTQR